MTHSNPILITGAAGKYGAIGPAVISDLLKQGFHVRALVRTEDERSERLKALGAEVVVGDLLDLYAVKRAMHGVKRLYFSMSVSPYYLEATANVATVAKDVGIDAFVNMSQMTVSQMSVDKTTDSPQQKQHFLAEQVLRWSGLPVVTLRPTVYLDVLFLQFATATIGRQSAIMLPFGQGKTAPIAAKDVARCVTKVLEDPSPHIGKIYELTGPVSQDLNAMAGEYTAALGRPIRYVNVPAAVWEELLQKMGAGGAMSEHLFKHIVTMAALHRDGAYDRKSNHVEELTGKKPMSVRDFVSLHTEQLKPVPTP